MKTAIRITAVLVIWAAAGLTGVLAGAEDPLDSPYYSHQELAELMSELTFYVNYDDESMVPTIAAGERSLLRTEPPGWKNKPEPGKMYGKYAPGIVGKALRLESGAGLYAAEGNVTLETSGAIALWVKPLEWKENGDRNVLFFISRPRGNVILQRQAGAKKEDGTTLRHEIISAVIPKRKGSAHYWERLTNGEWHLLIFNWAWPTFSLSVDGKAFTERSLPQIPNDMLNETAFNLGSRGGAAPSLMDEVMVFARPLDASEARLIYHTVKDWSRERRHADAGVEQ